MSPRLPLITALELLRALRRDGWQQVRQRGSHIILKHPTKTGRVVVPMHTQDIATTNTRIDFRSGRTYTERFMETALSRKLEGEYYE